MCLKKQGDIFGPLSLTSALPPRCTRHSNNSPLPTKAAKTTTTTTTTAPPPTLRLSIETGRASRSHLPVPNPPPPTPPVVSVGPVGGGPAAMRTPPTAVAAVPPPPPPDNPSPGPPASAGCPVPERPPLPSRGANPRWVVALARASRPPRACVTRGVNREIWEEWGGGAEGEVR